MVWVIGRWTATASSYSSVIAPLITVSVALWLAGEAVTLTLLAGGALVLAGVYVGALSGAHAQPTPTGPKEMKA
jgi:drug/metabolite transporter (DMT)-like permease